MVSARRFREHGQRQGPLELCPSFFLSPSTIWTLNSNNIVIATYTETQPGIPTIVRDDPVTIRSGLTALRQWTPTAPSDVPTYPIKASIVA